MSSSSRIGRRAQGTTNEPSANKHIPHGNYPSETQEIDSAGVASPEFTDSGFCENEESNTPRVDYQDFVLFNNVDLTQDAHNFFADADSSTAANHGSVYEGSNNEITTQIERFPSHAAQQSRFYDAVREAVSINAAVFTALSNNENDRTPTEHPKCPLTPYLRPLELWENTFERHESIAYRFEQPPHIVLSQRSRQQRR